MHIVINEFEPLPPLRPYVQSYWLGDFNLQAYSQLSQSMVPNGCIEIVIHLTDNRCRLFDHNGWTYSPDYTVIGMLTLPYAVTFSDRVQAFGIRLSPEGFYHIFGVPPATLLNSHEDIAAVVGNSFRKFCEQVRTATDVRERVAATEKYFLQRLSSGYLRDDYVALAAGLIRKSEGMLTVARLDEQIPVSKRQLQRRFKEIVGATPRDYIRIARINAVHKYLNIRRRLNFTCLAYERGFADQAHFIREFRQLTGDAPGVYLREREKYIVNPA